MLEAKKERGTQREFLPMFERFSPCAHVIVGSYLEILRFFWFFSDEGKLRKLAHFHKNLKVY